MRTLLEALLSRRIPVPARPLRRPPGTALTLALLAAPACGGCDDSEEAILSESQRLWGREAEAARFEALAEERLDARALDRDAALRRRVLDMPFREVVARLGFVRSESTARFTLERNGHRIEVDEDTRIESGLHGGWRVVQRDRDGALTRERVYANGLYYVRNGPGALRAQGVADRPGELTLEEAFQPLSAFTGWFGDQLDLQPAEDAVRGDRRALRYRFALGPEGGLVEDPRRPGRRVRPERLAGLLWVDAETAAPLAAELTGTLAVEPPPNSPHWGRLEVALELRITPIPGAPIAPGESVPPIVHRSVELDPLGFLEGETRTSTVIGGPDRGR